MDSFTHQIIVSCLIRNEFGEVLLVKHHKRGWELPQGRVEEGESVLAALHREVMEETGVTIAAPALAAVWSKLTSPTALILTFAATHATGTPTPSEETPEVRWFSEEDVFLHVNHPVNLDRVKAALAFSGAPSYHAYTTGPYTIVPAPSIALPL